jgi:hypothetical protein
MVCAIEIADWCRAARGMTADLMLLDAEGDECRSVFPSN